MVYATGGETRDGGDESPALVTPGPQPRGEWDPIATDAAPVRLEELTQQPGGDPDVNAGAVCDRIVGPPLTARIGYETVY